MSPKAKSLLNVVAAERLLNGNRGLARMLAALVEANGRTVPFESLAEARVLTAREANINSVRVRACWLREMLADMGFAKAIVSDRGVGYRLRDPAEIRAALDAETA